MAAPLLFISDLHLEESRPDITTAFQQFLQRNHGQCSALYILGDLFEVWIGDDEITPLSELVASELSTLAQLGTEIFIMHGNRDFLIGEDYARRCRATLLGDPHILTTREGNYVLAHGDSLCVDDVEYQQFRTMVRQAAWQQQFLGQTLDERREFARQAREQSQAATANKDLGIMDVNQAAVLQLLTDCQQTNLIHGHTHRPAEHHIELDSAIEDSNTALRLVLGDWDKKGWFASLDAGNLQLQEFSF